ncbi:FKBP-type peptidyl-prolyl cis-trans isomerase [Nocardioides ferulae]|uniref:FKBP-type peptidyl-prolyl cis-trans isomerase n=1 Tax=Nocardioides ferulae TaxID=2340821 RepID=UPI000EAF02F3|nr:FKBP-type peptidyl-prolyl cis-trans isomerase [Nocardioides ferulae]
MLRRLRRPSGRAASILLPALLLTTLVACGEENGEDDTAGESTSGGGALSAISITGEFGQAPEVEWDGNLEVDEIESEVLIEGDGDTVETGDQVSANFWVGNGYTQEEVYSTFGATAEQQEEDAAAAEPSEDAESEEPEGGKGDKPEPSEESTFEDIPATPETITISDELSPFFKAAFEDQTVGSRVVVAATATDAFGEGGNPQLGIGNEDTVLLVADIVEIQEVLTGPEGEEQEAPSWAPGLVTEGDAITGLDFEGTPEPDGKLRSGVLIQGEGPKVQAGQTITVNYLGQVYGGEQPFDESYSRGAPASFGIGVGQVITGWDKTLVGANVGSRLILAIPPAEGYGENGNEGAGIKGTDTLYFVVDILAAA